MAQRGGYAIDERIVGEDADPDGGVFGFGYFGGQGGVAHNFFQAIDAITGVAVVVQRIRGSIGQDEFKRGFARQLGNLLGIVQVEGDTQAARSHPARSKIFHPGQTGIHRVLRVRRL